MSSDIVTTSLGKVRGKLVKVRDGRPVHIYRNIPFAKPPTGQLRFMPPVKPDPWDGIKDGTVVGNKPWYIEAYDAMIDGAVPTVKTDNKPSCDEDCLHVSVYTPHSQKGKKLPVMVWLYGGNFQMGSESEYDGSVLSGMNDVVVVIPNYRVGIFGFLSLGPNSVCRGNAGLLDQQFALRWVQENIEDFGGDKNNVTIFGESAGGSSVHLNILSPLSLGLFHKAISQSGQAFFSVLEKDDPMITKSKRLLASELKIAAKDDKELLEALQGCSAKDIMKLMESLFMHGVYFTPCVDGHVLPKDIDDLIDEKDFAKVPYVIGVNNTEGRGMLAMFSGRDYIGGFTEDEARNGIYVKLTDEGYEKCKKKYLKEENGARKHSEFFSDIIQEAIFLVPAVHSAVRHAETGSDVFVYVGAFKLKMFHEDEFRGEIMARPKMCECDHGDDVYMTFGSPFAHENLTKGVKFSSEEAELSRNFMTYLANFAKTGDPNKGNDVTLQWPKYKPHGNHLIVKSQMATGSGLGKDEVKYWREEMKPHIKG